MMEDFARLVSRKRVSIDTTHTLNVSSEMYTQVEKELLREIEWVERLYPFNAGDRVIIQKEDQLHWSNRGQIIGTVEGYSEGVLYFSVQSFSELMRSE